ncbi:MAG TPA: NAD(P)H-binding protein [Burkholderiaceae bacterium]
MKNQTKRLLIIGCGDVGMRVLKLLAPQLRVFALTSDPSRLPLLRASGATPLLGNLDHPRTLARLAGLADWVLHLAPPQGEGKADLRTRNLLSALALRSVPSRLVYVSTTGVYGDCAGASFDETRAVAPATERAQRRVDAEWHLRRFGSRHACHVTLLRAPGIYALDRAGGDPTERVRAGTPLLRREDDVYTNRVHADDLARACVAALMRGLPQRTVHVCDDSQMLMGDYFDRVADLAHLPRAPRISRVEAEARLSATRLSFLSESRRLVNERMKRELRLTLHYPSVDAAFA